MRMVSEPISTSIRPAQKLGKAIRLAQWMREQPIACSDGRHLEHCRRVPKEPLVDEPATEIPNRSRHDPTRPRDAHHLGQDLAGVRHEREHQLSQCRGKCRVVARESGGVGPLKAEIGHDTVPRAYLT